MILQKIILKISYKYMIYRNGKLVSEINKNLSELIDTIEQVAQRSIGAVYKGSQLVFLTVLNAIKSCYGSGSWLSDKNWLDNDYWKNK